MFVKYIKSTFLYMKIIQIKTACFVYTFQLSLYHANFGQFKANRFFRFTIV